MGERFIGDLLKELDKAYQERKLTIGELVDEKGLPLELIIEASMRDLIANANSPREPLGIVNNKNTPCILTIKGFELLNQIRMKEAIEKFNKSSDKFSNVIIYLTMILVILSLGSVFYKFIIIGISVVIVCIVFSKGKLFSWFGSKMRKLSESGKKVFESEKEYWEQMIGLILLIFATYTITKDLLNEKTLSIIPSLSNSIVINAIFYAGILDIILVIGLHWYGKKIS
jgi:hypothetical protein